MTEVQEQIKEPEAKKPEIRKPTLPPASPPKLPAHRLKQAEMTRVRYMADIPHNTSMEEVLKPSFWAHHTFILKPMDLIEVCCEDGTWETLLRVQFVSKAEVVVSPIWKVYHDSHERAEETETHYVKWISPVNKYGVIHRETGNVVQDRLYPKDKAYEFLHNHIRRVR